MENINSIKRKILNAQKLRATKHIANKLYVTHFSEFSVDDRVWLANELSVNFLSLSFYKKTIEYNIPKEDYLDTIVFCLENLKINKGAFKVYYSNNKYSYSSIKLNNFVVNWINISKRFENTEKINKLFLKLFCQILDITDKKEVYNSIKEFIRNKEFFVCLGLETLQEIEKKIYEFYISDETCLYQDISLSSELIISSEHFKRSINSLNKYEYKFNLIDLDVLLNHPELKEHVVVHIKNKGNHLMFKKLQEVGFKCRIYTNIMDHFNDLKKGYSDSMKINNIIASLPDETKLFLIDTINLEDITPSILLDLKEFINNFGELEEDGADLFVIKHAI